MARSQDAAAAEGPRRDNAFMRELTALIPQLRAFARTLTASVASTTPASATARFVTPPLSGEPSESSATAEMVRSCPSASKCTVSLGRTRRTGR